MVTWAVKNSNAKDRRLLEPNSYLISVVSTSARVMIGQCNSFDIVENHNRVSAKQNRGGNLEGESLRWQGWWINPLQVMSHVIQRRHAGTQETLLNKTNKGNYHFELFKHDVFVPLDWSVANSLFTSLNSVVWFSYLSILADKDYSNTKCSCL